MIIVSSADIAVIINVHILPEFFENVNNLINVLLGGNALFSSFLLDFETMLVGSCKKHYVMTLHSFISGN